MTATTINGKKPKFFTTPIADSGTKTDIPATGGDDTVSQQQGFPSKFSTPRGSGGKSVGRSDMNGLFNGVSSLNYYFQYTGRNPWVSGQSYPKGAKVWHEGTTAEYVSTKDDNTDTPGASGVTTWIKLNDLSGTSGGGTTVDCAWSSRASEIGGLLTNAGKIPGLETKVNALTGDVSTLKTDMTNVKSNITSMQGSISTLQTSVAGISTKLDNMSVKPAFLDFSKAKSLNPTTESQSGYTTVDNYVVTAPNDGRLFVTYENYHTTTADVTLRIYAGDVTPTGTVVQLKTIALMGYSGGTSTNITLRNNFETDMKSGQELTFSKISCIGSSGGTMSGYLKIVAVFVPFVN